VGASVRQERSVARRWIGRNSLRRESSVGQRRLRGGLGKQALREWERQAIVASAIVMAGIITVFAWKTHNGARPPLPLTHTYVTAAGEYRTVAFAKDASVLLGPTTRLEVASNAANRSIEVRVIGEGFFTIKHHAGQSLQVRTGSAVARVLGTTFMVRQYPRDRVAKVVVVDGRVQISSLQTNSHEALTGGSSRVLSQRMLGTVDDSGRVHVTPNIVVEEYTGWTTGTLVFRNTPAREVVTDIGHAYGVDIRIADSTLASLPLSWTVALARRSLSDVLEALVDVLNASPVRNGSIITFVPSRSARPRSHPSRSLSTAEHTYGK
jgi:ferric-dicitrate binding protein FerR (iron transport regulator)